MTALLEADHPDVEQLAREALTLAWQLADARERLCLVLEQPGVGLAVYGPADTRNELMKAIGSRIVAAGPDPATGHVRTLLPLTEGET